MYANCRVLKSRIRAEIRCSATEPCPAADAALQDVSNVSTGYQNGIKGRLLLA